MHLQAATSNQISRSLTNNTGPKGYTTLLQGIRQGRHLALAGKQWLGGLSKYGATKPGRLRNGRVTSRVRRRNALGQKLGGERVRLVTLNNTVNAKLFLNSTNMLGSTNPSVVLNCTVTKFVTFLVVHRLNRVVIRRPITNSFDRFTRGC